jgi:hypothetical protein
LRHRACHSPATARGLAPRPRPSPSARQPAGCSVRQVHRSSAEARSLVSRAFSSWNRSIVTGIYLCHACSYHEIDSGNVPAGPAHPRGDAAAALPGLPVAAAPPPQVITACSYWVAVPGGRTHCAPIGGGPFPPGSHAAARLRARASAPPPARPLVIRCCRRRPMRAGPIMIRGVIVNLEWCVGVWAQPPGHRDGSGARGAGRCGGRCVLCGGRFD